jgi:TRAP-type C4-dicarboxylate transport system permease small subunit
MTTFELVINYLGKFNEFILNWFTRLATLLIAVMTGIVLIQVFFRYVLNHSLPWPEELAKFMMVWMTFLVAPYAYRQGLNVNMELFVSRIPPRLRSILEILLHVFIILLAFYLLREGLGMMKRGIRIRASTVNFKMAYVYVIVPISFGMMMIGGGERILRDIKAIISPETPTEADLKSSEKPNDI